MVVADGCDVMMIKGKLFACDVEMIIELMCDLFLLAINHRTLLNAHVNRVICERTFIVVI